MASAYLNSIAHPNELSALLTYTFAKKSTNRTRHENTIAMDPSKERCYHFLNKTSRSFAAVIQELDDALRDAVCLFYLVLRGLDTIEDDMSLPVERKVDLLRSFDKIIFQKGWTFHENGPNEKDRHLLVEFDCVIQEFLRLKPGFQRVIADITHKMGHGMADYALGEHRENTSVATIADFDLYCYYVAGLVGHGLSELFVESGLEDAPVAMNKKEANDMGLFLQKTNIIRDYREDLDEKRQFWPKEIWGKYVDRFEDLILPENKEKAYTCLSSMVLNVLDTMPSVLSYLSNLRSPSVFNFAAIPQVMAIATLALVFNNLDIYHKNIKIRKGEAIRLILDCTDIHSVIRIFRQYTQVISQKNDPKDPNFLGISMAIGKMEQWIVTHVKESPTALSSSSSSSSSSSGSYVLPVAVCLLAAVLFQIYKNT